MEKSKFKITFLTILRALHHHLLPPLLTDKKSNSIHHLVQDLQPIHPAVVPRCPVAPNPTRFFLLSLQEPPLLSSGSQRSFSLSLSVLSLKISVLSPGLVLTSPHSSPDCPTPRDFWIAHIDWPGSSFWPTLPVSPQIETHTVCRQYFTFKPVLRN